MAGYRVLSVNKIKARESSQTMKHKMSGILSLITFSFKSGGLRVWKAYDVGPGKRFAPAHEEWIWKTSRAYRLVPRVTLQCTARKTGSFRSTILTSVSSNSLSLEPCNLLKKSAKFSKLRECIPPTLKRDAQSHTSLLQSEETHGCG